MAGRKLILIIDDDPQVCHFAEGLLVAHFDIVKASSNEEGLKLLKERHPALIILELGMRSEHGLDLCQMVRQTPELNHIPVVVFSDTEDLEQITMAFDHGADDFITKETKPQEFLARIISKIKRLELLETHGQALECGNLRLNLLSGVATLSGQSLSLSELEFRILTTMVQRQNNVLTREQLRELAWRGADISDRVIDTHLNYLMRKLAGFSENLHALVGAGYILETKEVAAKDKHLRLDQDLFAEFIELSEEDEFKLAS